MWSFRPNFLIWWDFWPILTPGHCIYNRCILLYTGLTVCQVYTIPSTPATCILFLALYTLHLDLYTIIRHVYQCILMYTTGIKPISWAYKLQQYVGILEPATTFEYIGGLAREIGKLKTKWFNSEKLRQISLPSTRKRFTFTHRKRKELKNQHFE